MRADILYAASADGLYVLRAREQELPGLERRVLAGHDLRQLLATDAETLLVTLADGHALQSFDAGASWLPAPKTPPPATPQVMTLYGPAALAYRRLSDATAYARLEGKPAALLGAGADGRLLFRSEDEGIHWEPAAMPAELIGRVTALAPSPVKRNRAYAATDQGVLLGSEDRGRRWQCLLRLPVALHGLAIVASDD